MSILSLVPIILGLLICAPFIRLSSRIILKVGLQWRICLIFSVVVYVMLVMNIILQKTLQLSISPMVAIPAGFMLNLTCGTLLLGNYGKRIDGNKLGYKIGFIISALGMSLMLLFGLMLFGGLIGLNEMLRHN